MRRVVVVFLAVIVALLTLFFPLSSPTVCSAKVISPDGWAWQNPLPQGNDLQGVWGTSSSDVFAVGYYGTIVHYDGSAWSPMTSGTTNWLVFYFLRASGSAAWVKIDLTGSGEAP